MNSERFTGMDGQRYDATKRSNTTTRVSSPRPEQELGDSHSILSAIVFAPRRDSAATDVSEPPVVAPIFNIHRVLSHPYDSPSSSLSSGTDAYLPSSLSSGTHVEDTPGIAKAEDTKDTEVFDREDFVVTRRVIRPTPTVTGGCFPQASSRSPSSPVTSNPAKLNCFSNAQSNFELDLDCIQATRAAASKLNVCMTREAVSYRE